MLQNPAADDGGKAAVFERQMLEFPADQKIPSSSTLRADEEGERSVQPDLIGACRKRIEEAAIATTGVENYLKLAWVENFTSP